MNDYDHKFSEFKKKISPGDLFIKHYRVKDYVTNVIDHDDEFRICFFVIAVKYDTIFYTCLYASSHVLFSILTQRLVITQNLGEFFNAYVGDRLRCDISQLEIFKYES